MPRNKLSGKTGLDQKAASGKSVDVAVYCRIGSLENCHLSNRRV